MRAIIRINDCTIAVCDVMTKPSKNIDTGEILKLLDVEIDGCDPKVEEGDFVTVLFFNPSKGRGNHNTTLSGPVGIVESWDISDTKYGRDRTRVSMELTSYTEEYRG